VAAEGQLGAGGTKRTILVTGAGGFVGRFLVPLLLADGDAVRAVVRAAGRPAPNGAATVVVEDLEAVDDWGPLLDGVDAVVHLAARVHIPGDRAPDRAVRYRRTNTEATAALATAAARAGVDRFVHVSTFALAPVLTSLDRGVLDEADAWDAHPYEMSKIAAERALGDIADATGLPAVVLRPPLVYGPGAVANFALLLRAVRGRWPLPLGAVRNRRSLIYVGNLADAVRACLRHPAAPGNLFAVSDGEDVSTPELARRLARAIGAPPPILPPVPPALLAAALKLAGRGGWVQRLMGDAWLDPTPIRTALGWTPPYTLDQGLASLAGDQGLASLTAG